MTSDLHAGGDTGWSHEYNSKMEISSESPKYECQHIWGKVILQHANRALSLVPVPRQTQARRAGAAKRILFLLLPS